MLQSIAELTTRLHWLIALLVLIWGMQIVNMISAYKLIPLLGLIPRRLSRLHGIVMMPALHGSFSHALANTYPLVTLGGLMGYSSGQQLPMASAIIIVGGGLGVWLLGRKAMHIGASGLIFGWFAYLLARGIADANIKTMAIACGVALSYGTMFFAMLPRDRRVSWEAHLFSAIAGVGAALIL